MKNADWPRLWLKNESSESDVAARTHTQYNNNDRSGTTRLSKIAHIGSIDVSSSDWPGNATFRLHDEDSLPRECAGSGLAKRVCAPKADRIRGRNRNRPYMCGA